MRRVLVVEKDEFTSEVLAESLRYLDYDPVISSSPATLALEVIETSPDIVIIYRKLFLKNRHLFFLGTEKIADCSIILTSGAYIEQERVRNLGADYFLYKPFKLDDLIEVLEKATSN